ncbi:tetratricopeptide repeat protein [Actinomadura luteofluorescens]|uniref:Tetratricopeptide (TPR) repeat protein n=1 Tax=Actinomadura luteofluorescens TaxID=46163 RepID=A0A7Y9EBS6_9ACTN|nr:tetratricopeptide repeat protein [Actinomadura luteofluorescens]NYD44778.1 tetratricopeptide (TPR) repeat protein [Actinomadura luteofluorescens]NYD52010.1 tetratricopeptide (TPR) repeat protein [Actinomadura luteofluorescens]
MLSTSKLRHAAFLLLPATALAVASIAVVGVVRGPAPARRDPGPAASARPADAAAGAIARYQRTLRGTPGDYATWAALGAAYVQQARITVDPAYYARAEGALRRSLALNAAGNHRAMIAMAALANARHEFTDAVRWGRRAERIDPASPELYGVLTDAYTQLGDYPAATAAVARMNDLGPGVAAFTRASYELETHGDDAGARRVLTQAAEDAYTPSDVAYCRYYLGELALHSGDLEEAVRQYQAARSADPTYVPAAQGIAKTQALRGDLAGAINGYRDVVGRVPQPQYIAEYIELLRAAGRTGEAAEQHRLLLAQRGLMAGNGVVDDLSASEYAASAGDAAGALRHARAEWARRRSVVVADALAWALHLSGRDRRALRHAEQATRLGWRNALFYSHRAEIHAALGDHNAARRDRATARRINPHLDLRFPAIGRAS